jgi:hypothetical protein
MASSPLSRSTQRRLLKLALQPNSIWEGDRLSLNFRDPGGATEDLEENRDCILWVDGIHGVVRAMDLVPASTGQEAIVRTLLQAMEQPMDTPNQISRPARPKKIVVRSRELQFFLRGVLQGLDTAVEYQPELPLIDEFFSGLQQMMSNRVPPIPPEYADALEDASHRLWQLAPWKDLYDHQIIRINLPDLEEQPELYVSVLGNLGMEFGILFYRSLDSLKLFRQTIADADHPQEAFFRQDCHYVTFNRPLDLEVTPPSPPVSLDWEDLEVEFGSIHPMEGMQAHLGEEEAQTVLLALEALMRFVSKHRQSLKNHRFPALQSKFKLSFPEVLPPKLAKVSVSVATEPEIAEQLLALTDFDDDDDDYDDDEDFDLDDLDFRSLLEQMGITTSFIPIEDDLIPDGSLITMVGMSWDMYQVLQELAHCKVIGPRDLPEDADLPAIVVQTTRPKAKTLLAEIEAAGGLAGVTFTKDSEDCEIGILKLKNGEMKLLNSYDLDNPVYQKLRQRWKQQVTLSKGLCGLVITDGITGKRRGQVPGVRDVMMLLTAPYIEMGGFLY